MAPRFVAADPSSLTRDQLVQALRRIQAFSYGLPGRRGAVRWHPDKEIGGADCVDEVTDALREAGLDPRRPARKRGTPALVCPKCGYDGKTPPRESPRHPFRVIEDLSAQWPVLSAEGGVIRADGDDRDLIDESYENTRIECGDCLHEFPVPEGMKVEW